MGNNGETKKSQETLDTKEKVGETAKDNKDTIVKNPAKVGKEDFAATKKAVEDKKAKVETKDPNEWKNNLNLILKGRGESQTKFDKIATDAATKNQNSFNANYIKDYFTNPAKKPENFKEEYLNKNNSNVYQDFLVKYLNLQKNHDGFTQPKMEQLLQGNTISLTDDAFKIILEKDDIAAHRDGIINSFQSSYPGSIISINDTTGEVSILYSKDSITQAVKAAFDTNFDNTSKGNVDAVNSTAGESISNNVDTNIENIENSATKEALKNITDTINTASSDLNINNIQTRNKDMINTNLNGNGTVINNIKDIKYTLTAKTNRPMASAEIINTTNAKDAKGNEINGVLDVQDGDIGKTKGELHTIKGDLLLVTGDQTKGYNMAVYSLDQNSLIDKLISQPSELKNIENTLHNALNNKETDINTTVTKIGSIQAVDATNVIDVKKDISEMEKGVKDLEGIVNKFGEFYISIDKPNDLKELQGDQKAEGIKSRSNEIQAYKTTGKLGEYQKKLNELKTKLTDYNNSEQIKSNDAIYSNIIKNPKGFNETIKDGNEFLYRALGAATPDQIKTVKGQINSKPDGMIRNFTRQIPETNGNLITDHVILEKKGGPDNTGKPSIMYNTYREVKEKGGSIYFKDGGNVSVSQFTTETQKAAPTELP